MRIWLFRLIAIALPFVFLILFEGLLRLVGFGQTVPLFIDNPAHPDYRLARPDIISRYFPDPNRAPNVTLEPTFFLKDKPENSVRIVVQGGSTAAGFPYGLGASLAGMLEHRLRASLPSHHVEVINTSLSAVNSYTLLDLADDIVEIAPDAVLIYAGHNEYLGILGVGSNYTDITNPAIMRLYLSLKEWRLFQLMQSLYAAFLPAATNEAGASRTLMAQIAKHKDIPYGSAMYNAGIEQFTGNMQRLIETYRAHGIPVYIATMASNLANQAPFSSSPMTDNERMLLQDYAQGKSVNIDSDTRTYSADFWYAIGRSAQARGQHEQARAYFTHAKDADLLRFRAPQAINDVIQGLADRPGVTLVDSEAHLRSRSANGIIGNALMLEHLHPNLQGYFLLADSFYRAIESQGQFTPWKNISIEQAWRNRPVLPAEEYMGFAMVKRLMADYPFVDEPQMLALPRPADEHQRLGLALFEKNISWLEMVKRSQQLYRQQNNREMVIKTSRLLADALPHDPEINAKAAALMTEQQNWAEAYYYLRRSQRAGNVTPGIEKQLRMLQAKLN
ncbi:SGNH/GDSL hydrolase family protein [Aestuariibacter salexigens]|uniref:SGNH/GDSL hydrolase family protein n=1 Tax=Aestuariibacter salexigens TaxID=226010 RepID=UPI0003F5771C|nr:GDSL-type esterase/lipase family protein [Aestuariibacter salexigens]